MSVQIAASIILGLCAPFFGFIPWVGVVAFIHSRYGPENKSVGWVYACLAFVIPGYMAYAFLFGLAEGAQGVLDAAALTEGFVIMCGIIIGRNDGLFQEIPIPRVLIGYSGVGFQLARLLVVAPWPLIALDQVTPVIAGLLFSQGVACGWLTTRPNKWLRWASGVPISVCVGVAFGALGAVVDHI